MNHTTSERAAGRSTKRFGSAGMALLLVLALAGCQVAPPAMRTADLGARPGISFVQPPSGPAPLATSSGLQPVCMQFGFGLSGSDKAALGGILVVAAPIILPIMAAWFVLWPFAEILGRF